MRGVETPEGLCYDMDVKNVPRRGGKQEERNMRNRLLAVLLAGALMLSLVGTALAEDEVTEDGGTETTEPEKIWVDGLRLEPYEDPKNEENSGWMVVEYDGKADVVVIPAIYKEKPVVRIADQAFEVIETGKGEGDKLEGKKLTNITIPGTVTYVGKAAFKGCKSLDTVIFLNNTKGDKIERNTSIEANAFEGCNALGTLVLSANTEYIKGSAFRGCSRLETVIIPKLVDKIYTDAFSDCTALKDVTFLDVDTDITGAFFFDTIKTVHCIENSKPYNTVKGLVDAYPTVETEIHLIENVVVKITSEASCKKTGAIQVSFKCPGMEVSPPVTGNEGNTEGDGTTTSGDTTPPTTPTPKSTHEPCKVYEDSSKLDINLQDGAKFKNGEYSASRTTSMVPHKAEPIEKVTATCTSAGSNGGKKCSVCGAIIEEPAPVNKLPHTWEDPNGTVVTREATCTEEGSKTTTRHCTECEEDYPEVEVLEKKDHTYAGAFNKEDENFEKQWKQVYVKDAVCKAAGLKGYRRLCIYCGALEPCADCDKLTGDELLAHWEEHATGEKPDPLPGTPENPEDTPPVVETPKKKVIILPGVNGKAKVNEAEIGPDGKIEFPEVEADAGYVLDCWTDKRGNRIAENKTFKDGDEIIKPAPVVTTITEAENGTAEGSVVIGPYSTITQFPTPVPADGYEFDHWEDADGNVVDENTVINAAISIKPVFKPEESIPDDKTVTVTVLEGEHGKANVDSVTTGSDGKIAEFPEVTADEGYILDHWENEDEEEVDENTVFGESASIKPVFKEDEEEEPDPNPDLSETLLTQEDGEGDGGVGDGGEGEDEAEDPPEPDEAPTHVAEWFELDEDARDNLSVHPSDTIRIAKNKDGSDKITIKYLEHDCTKGGTKTTTYHCDTCQWHFDVTEDIAPFQKHDCPEPVPKVFPATGSNCNEPNKTIIPSVACQREGCEYKTEEKVEETASGHVWGDPVQDEGKNNQEATCARDGVSYVTVTCKTCGITESRTITIPKTGRHTWGEWRIAARPSEDGEGTRERTCSVCGEKETAPLNACTEHIWGEWTITKKPTATEEGSRTHTCDRCGTTEEEKIPALGGGSSSGGTSTPAPAYTITAVQPANGKISASVSSAAAGARITITLRADSGYELDWVEARRSDGSYLILSGSGDSRAFWMPSANVEVRARFTRMVSTPADSSSDAVSQWASQTQSPIGSVPRLSTTSQNYTDIPASHWAAGEIEWASRMGYMSGSSRGQFNPDSTITYQQLWMVLARLNGSHPSSMEEARRWAVNEGFAEGANPDVAVTRHQLVTALYRCARLMGSTNRNTTSLAGYADSRLVPAPARDAMAWAVANGIVSGTANGRLDPAATTTRAQFAVILYRYSQRI